MSSVYATTDASVGQVANAAILICLCREGQLWYCAFFGRYAFVVQHARSPQMASLATC